MLWSAYHIYLVIGWGTISDGQIMPNHRCWKCSVRIKCSTWVLFDIFLQWASVSVWNTEIFRKELVYPGSWMVKSWHSHVKTLRNIWWALWENWKIIFLLKKPFCLGVAIWLLDGCCCLYFTAVNKTQQQTESVDVTTSTPPRPMVALYGYDAQQHVSASVSNKVSISAMLKHKWMSDV